MTRKMVGERFGKLVVIAKNGKNEHGIYTLLCRCDCGNELIVRHANICSGNTKSCGCIIGNPTHGHSRNYKKSAIYKTWLSMHSRCKNKNVEAFKYYGGRGIKVCERWESFEFFFEDMGERPENTSLDRINNDGDYEPANCAWSTRSEQCRNQRKNRLISYNDEVKCLAEWSEIKGIKYDTLVARLNKGWSVDDSLNRPTQKRAAATRDIQNSNK